MTKPLFHCEIEFHPLLHLNQLYDGFWKLKQKGIIDLVSKRVQLKDEKPVIRVIVNNKHTIIYDTLDGFNWIDGTVDENLEFFKTHSNCDLYFKRSFDPVLYNYMNKDKIHPLGLNFSFHHDGNYPFTISERLKSLVKRKIKKNSFKLEAFEHPPLMNQENRILFLCGLWNPDEVESSELKTQRNKINADRMEFIRTCKAEFGSRFTGGIQISEYAQKVAKDILVPIEITNKRNFMSSIKSHNICIATTGLHNSTGYKFAEYIAASRAVISEPLHYQLPGNFSENKNYLSFENSEELITNIQSLLRDTTKMQSMMIENYRYYNNYVDSEKLVLNTLLKTKDL